MNKRRVLFAVGGLGGAAGLVVTVLALQRACLNRQAGDAQWAIRVGGVLVIDDLQVVEGEDNYDEQSRLTAIDMVTGEQIARRTIEARPWCLPAGDELLCQMNQDAEFIYPKTLRTVVDVDAMARKLVPGAKLVKGRLELDDGAALVLLDDARVVRVGARGEAQVDPTYRDVKSFGGYGYQTCPQDYRLAKTEPDGARTRVNDTESFITPELLLGGPDGVLVLHAPKIDAKKTQLSLLGKQLAWTIELGAECAAVFREGDQFVVATHATTKRVLAIDAATGKVRWTVGF